MRLQHDRAEQVASHSVNVADQRRVGDGFSQLGTSEGASMSVKGSRLFGGGKVTAGESPCPRTNYVDDPLLPSGQATRELTRGACSNYSNGRIVRGGSSMGVFHALAFTTPNAIQILISPASCFRARPVSPVRIPTSQLLLKPTMLRCGSHSSVGRMSGAKRAPIRQGSLSAQASVSCQVARLYAT